MGKQFQHLLEPIRVGNHLLKNRLVATPSAPSFVQQNEPYPLEGLIQHYANKARGGAAIVACSGSKIALEASMKPPALLHEFEFEYEGDINHYLSQLTEAIHDQGSFATIVEKHLYDNNRYDIAHVPSMVFPGSNLPPVYGEEMTESMLRRCTEEMVERIYKLKQVGFDGVYVHMAYKVMLLGRALSPLTNKRTDKYGGSFENRIRLPLETCRAIKEACGKDFIVDVCITGEERDSASRELIPGGWTIEDSIRFAQAAEGCIDILHVRGWDMDEQHPLGFFADEPPYLYLAEAVKKSAPAVKVLTVSGHHDPEMMDRVIAEGKADLIGMGRGWISNPDFGSLVADGRSDDIVPCIRCNKCFRPSADAPYTSRCSVNPLFGIEHRYKNLIVTPEREKRVAVVGGGPAGMQLAITLRRRGHQVTLFEKNSQLGGQLCLTDHVSFKWPLKDYKDYLVREMGKLAVDVRLGMAATPQMVDDEGFEVVFLAMGSMPKKSSIPGADGENVYSALEVFGHEAHLGQQVVVIGAGESGVETGMYLAEKGHTVTLLASHESLAPEMSPLHYRTMVESAWEQLDGFGYVLGVRAKSIDAKGVTYTDGEGNDGTLPADSVVLAIGNEPLHDEAIEFSKCKARLFIIGDNRKPASVMELNREAFYAASQV